MTLAHRGRLAAVVVLTVLNMLLPTASGLISAVPLASTPERASTDQPYVTLEKDTLACSVDSTFSADVRVAIDRPTGYLESRLQIHSRGGDLIYQKTEVRNDVATGTVTIGYSRALGDLGLKPGAYPITLRVRSDASGEVRQWDVKDELLIYDPDLDPVPLVLVAKISSAPLIDPQGRFVIDPTHAAYAREQVESLAALVVARKELKVSLALPPILAEEWLRASQGYEYVDAAGVVQVSPDSEYSRACANTLAMLGTAIETGRLELMDVPYADPDVEGLLAMNHLDDLSAHYEQGLSAYLAAIETSPSASTMLAAGQLPAAATGVLAQRGITTAVVAPSSLEETAAGLTAGRIGEDVSALIVDEAASDALRSGETSTFVRAVFARHVSEEPTAPVVAVAEIGPGSPCDVSCVESCTDELLDAPWVDARTAAAGAAETSSSARTIELTSGADTGSDAPADYWSEVKAARTGAEALHVALGPNDDDARFAGSASLIAESRMWAGYDGAWSLADRGRAHAAAARRVTEAVLRDITVAASDITLSGARGSIPVQIINPGDKVLSLSMQVFPERLAVLGDNPIAVALRPAENFLTVPVDLQSSLSGTVRIELKAGEVVLDETTVTVRASYLDRLAVIGGITVVLAVMLWFIRKRARNAEVGIIADRSRRRSNGIPDGGDG